MWLKMMKLQHLCTWVHDSKSLVVIQLKIIGQLLNFWLKLISTNLQQRNQTVEFNCTMKLVLIYNAEFSTITA